MSHLAGLTIIDAMDSQAFWRRWFKDHETWSAWRAFIKSFFGLPLTAAELTVFKECTGRTAPPADSYLEGWLVVGRRGGKSFTLALIAVFLAVFRDWSTFLAPGERGTVMIICVDRKQARTIFRYCKALLVNVPTLAPLVERADNETLDLSNSISIEITSASYRTVRGYTVVAALCDEIAFWRTEEFAANPDVEILDALRPAMATVPGAVMLCASSPYAKKGALYEAHRDNFGKDDAEILVWRAPTLTMNPGIRRSVIDTAYERDPISAASEFGAEFRSDFNTFIEPELIEAAIDRGVHVRPPIAGIRYKAFADASSGRSDSFVISIAHAEGNLKIVDAIREWRAPFDAAFVLNESADFLLTYGCREVWGDKYAIGFVVAGYKARSIVYHAELTTRVDGKDRLLDRSSIYLNALPFFTSGLVRLIDHRRTAAQFVALERRTHPSGLDKVQHPDGGHDDCANACAGTLVLVAQGPQPLVIPPEAMAWARGLGREGDACRAAGDYRLPRSWRSTSTPQIHFTGPGQWPPK